MEESNNDATMAPGAAALPKKRRRKKTSAFSRHTSSHDRKKSKAPQASNVRRNPSQPTQAPSSDNTNDPRIYNLKRAVQRRNKRIEQFSTDNQELKRKVVTAEKDVQLVQREAAIQVNAVETKAEKLLERAAKKMRSAAEVTTRSGEKMAIATKAANDANTTKKAAAKEKTAATKERKKINNNKLADANRSNKKIDELTAKLKEAHKTIKILEKELLKAKQETQDERSARYEVEEALKDVEQVIEAKNNLIVIQKETRTGTGLKRWPLHIVQLIIEYLVCVFAVYYCIRFELNSHLFALSPHL